MPHNYNPHEFDPYYEPAADTDSPYYIPFDNEGYADDYDDDEDEDEELDESSGYERSRMYPEDD